MLCWDKWFCLLHLQICQDRKIGFRPELHNTTNCIPELLRCLATFDVRNQPSPHIQKTNLKQLEQSCQNQDYACTNPAKISGDEADGFFQCYFKHTFLNICWHVSVQSLHLIENVNGTGSSLVREVQCHLLPRSPSEGKTIRKQESVGTTITRREQANTESSSTLEKL